MNDSTTSSSTISMNMMMSDASGSPVALHRQMPLQTKKDSKRCKVEDINFVSVVGKNNSKKRGKRSSWHKKLKHSFSTSLNGLSHSSRSLGKSNASSTGEVGRRASLSSNHSFGSRGGSTLNVVSAQTYHGRPGGLSAFLNNEATAKDQAAVNQASFLQEIDTLKKQVKSLQETIRSTRKENHQLLEDAQELLEENDNVQKQLKDAVTKQQSVEHELDTLTLKLHKTEAGREHLQNEVDDVRKLLLKQVKSQLAKSNIDGDERPDCNFKATRRASLLHESCGDESTDEEKSRSSSVELNASELIQLLSNIQKRRVPHPTIELHSTQTQKTAQQQTREQTRHKEDEALSASQEIYEQPEGRLKARTIEVQKEDSQALYALMIVGGVITTLVVQILYHYFKH